VLNQRTPRARARASGGSRPELPAIAVVAFGAPR
jgi:hypothetical protein